MFDNSPGLPRPVPTAPVAREPKGYRVHETGRTDDLFPPCEVCDATDDPRDKRVLWDQPTRTKTCGRCGTQRRYPDWFGEEPHQIKARMRQMYDELDEEGRLPSSMPVEWWPPGSRYRHDVRAP